MRIAVKNDYGGNWDLHSKSLAQRPAWATSSSPSMRIGIKKTKPEDN
jgi:hypothetical protein